MSNRAAWILGGSIIVAAVIHAFARQTEFDKCYWTFTEDVGMASHLAASMCTAVPRLPPDARIKPDNRPSE